MQEIKISELTEATANDISNATSFIIARGDTIVRITWKYLKGAFTNG